MEIKRGNKSQDGLLASKKKGFDFSQLNPLEWEFLGGDRKMDIPRTWQNIKDAWGSDGDDSMVRDYTQAGGDAGGLEELYNQSLEEMDQPYGSATKGPKLPYEMWKPGVEMPEFVKSQQKSYKDPEISGRQLEEKRVLARMALAQQTPSLAPEDPDWLDKLLGNDKGSELAGAGGSVATVKNPNKKAEYFPNIVKQERTRNPHAHWDSSSSGSE